MVYGDKIRFLEFTVIFMLISLMILWSQSKALNTTKPHAQSTLYIQGDRNILFCIFQKGFIKTKFSELSVAVT